MTAIAQQVRIEPGELPRPRESDGFLAELPRGGLHLATERPSRSTMVLSATGEVDMGTAPRLAEILDCRVRSTLKLLVIDLSELDFLAVAGVSVLIQAHLQAQSSGVTMVIVTGGNRQVERALEVTRQHHNLALRAGPLSDVVAAGA